MLPCRRIESQTFADWNRTELQSFLIEITADIFLVKEAGTGEFVVDRILDKTGSKGTGKWTAQQAAEQAIPASTMSSALDARYGTVVQFIGLADTCSNVFRLTFFARAHSLIANDFALPTRYLSALLDERVAASRVLKGPDAAQAPKIDKAQLIDDVRRALYAAKICSYAQGMNLIRAAGKANGWALNLGAISRIWKGGCIIRAVFLDRIKACDQSVNMTRADTEEEMEG